MRWKTDSPCDTCEVSLGGLVGCDGDGRAHSNSLFGGVDHVYKVAISVARFSKF